MAASGAKLRAAGAVGPLGGATAARGQVRQVVGQGLDRAPSVSSAVRE